MRRIIALAALATLLALAALWWTGGFNALAHWAAGQQRGFQNIIASGLRATRGGDTAAFWTVLLASFAYGVVHAAGPGHGKIVIGGYGLARSVPMLRLSLIALAASLGQAKRCFCRRGRLCGSMCAREASRKWVSWNQPILCWPLARTICR